MPPLFSDKFFAQNPKKGLRSLVNGRRYAPARPGHVTEIEALNRLAATVQQLATVSASHTGILQGILEGHSASLEATRESIVSGTENSAAIINASAEQSKSMMVATRDLRKELMAARDTLNVIRLAATKPILTSVSEVIEAKQLSLEETMIKLANSETSMARFGDGEMKLMLKPEFRLAFQPNSPELMKDLKATISEPVDGLMVCMPQFHRDQHWAGIWADVWDQMSPLLSGQESYGNSHVSRPVLFRLLGDTGVEMWRSVWAGKDVKLITGKGSRFDMLPALFDSSASISRFDSLAIDAYSDTERLLDKGQLGDPDLFLLALGPTGTTLARELASRGKRVLDIGHLSASYQNVFEDGKWPENRPISV